MMDRLARAEALFRDGCNCAQAVLLAYADKLPMDEKTAAAISSPFGGGMGQLRETCGAFTGALMVLGCLRGDADPEDRSGRKAVYQDVQRIAELFTAENGSLVCGELLGMRERCSAPPDAPPIRRTPCSHKVASAVRALSQVLNAD